MHPYVVEMKKLFESNADPAAAGPMKAYMRDQFEFLGIKSKPNGELQRQFYAEHGLPAVEELDAVLRDLWALPQREFQYAAVGLLSKMQKTLPPDFVQTMEYLIVTKSWWDTVDSLAAHLVGAHFKRCPEVRQAVLPEWRASDNFWLRRTCLLFQLDYKNETDFDLLKDIIRENLGSREFFINKAIGWALRQYTRIDPEGVREFVSSTPLHPLSSREALKWLENQAAKERGHGNTL